MKPPLTYLTLFEKIRESASTGGVKSQTAANRATALRQFLKANHVQPEDVVGSEMRVSFAQAETNLAAALRLQGQGNRSVSNTLSAVRPCQIMVALDDKQRALDGENMTPFQAAVAEVVGANPIKTLARRCGISAHLLRGWIKGGRPREASLPEIRRFEAFFGMERDSLATLAGIKDGHRTRESVGTSPPNAFRERLSENKKLRYLLKPLPGSVLRQQWRDLIRYKTAPVPLLKRSRKGTWTFSPRERLPVAVLWSEFYDGRHVPSAGKCWTNVSSFYGWMALSPKHGGLGMPGAELDSLAWLAVGDYLEQYMDWRIKRTGGVMSQGVLEIVNVIVWMVRPTDGYLWQQPEFMRQLPVEFHGVEWKQRCATLFAYCRQLQDYWRPKLQISRDGFEPVRAVIDTSSPLEEIADMVQRMRNDRPVDNPQNEAIWARDILLVKLLASNPLRRANFISLTWNVENVNGHHPTNRESLYKRSDGSWWIYISKHLFKNRGSETLQDYDSPVDVSVWSDLEAYLAKYRPRLLRWETDLVFLAKTRDPVSECRIKDGLPYKQKLVIGHVPYHAIGNHVAKLTERYLRNCPGARMHAFRKIIATAVLKAEGGDIKTAALVLHDKESTVEKSYSGMRSGDGNARMSELLRSGFNRM